jgi:hypothetical protein
MSAEPQFHYGGESFVLVVRIQSDTPSSDMCQELETDSQVVSCIIFVVTVVFKGLGQKQPAI